MLKEFRGNFTGLIGLLAFSLCILSLVRLSSHAAASANLSSSTEVADIGGSDHYLYAAMYSTKGPWSSTLGLNNSQNHPITARITLFNKHGQVLNTPEMEITLGPHQNHGFNVADWIGSREGFNEGSLVVFFHGPLMALGAQEIVTDAQHSLNVDVHLTEYDDFKSNRAEGLWWALEGQSEANVFIANVRDTATNVTPVFYVRGLPHEGETITLGGHEIAAIDIEESLNKLHVSGDISAGGISLNYTNSPGSITAVGAITNKHTGFSTTMRFIDQASQKTTTLHGASLAIGRPAVSAGFPSGTRFTPVLFVRNNSNQPIEVKPRVRYTLNDQANTIKLETLTLNGREVRQIDLSDAINAVGNHRLSDSGIEIKHSGQPGAVMAYAASVDQSASMVLDVPIKDPKNMIFKGGSYPWNIEGNNRAVLHVKNIDPPGDGKKHQFMGKVYFDGGEYNLPLQEMEAGQTVEVDLKKLRDDQVKDVRGNLIPLNVNGGQLDWQGRSTRGEFIGRLTEYDPVGGTATSFSCIGACPCDPGFGHAVITPDDISGIVGDSFLLNSIETDTDCNEAVVYTYGVSADYASSNESVISVSGNTATLVGEGSAAVRSSWDTFTMATHCFLSAEGECVDATCTSRPVSNPIIDTGGIVQIPTQFIALTVTPSTIGCPSNFNGYNAQVSYQIADSLGHPVLRAMTPLERFSVNGAGYTPPDFSPFATPPSSILGVFLDVPVGTCAGVPPNSNFCVNVVQVFNVQVETNDGGTRIFPIDTVTTRRDCTQGIQVNVINATTQTFTLGTVPP